MKHEVILHIDFDGSTEDLKRKVVTLSRMIADCTVISVEKMSKPRTSKQNKALHLYFGILAEALNDSGQDMKHVIRTEISWSPYSVKEYLWRPLQKHILGKESTTELTTDEIDKIYDQMNRIIGERTGVYVPFPSMESLMNDYEHLH